MFAVADDKTNCLTKKFVPFNGYIALVTHTSKKDFKTNGNKITDSQIWIHDRKVVKNQSEFSDEFLLDVLG